MKKYTKWMGLLLSMLVLGIASGCVYDHDHRGGDWGDHGHGYGNEHHDFDHDHDWHP